MRFILIITSTIIRVRELLIFFINRSSSLKKNTLTIDFSNFLRLFLIFATKVSKRESVDISIDILNIFFDRYIFFKSLFNSFSKSTNKRRLLRVLLLSRDYLDDYLDDIAF